MNTKLFNGYRNWATWNTALWVLNIEEIYNEMKKARRKEIGCTFDKHSARNFVELMYPEGTPDMASAEDYSVVDWSDIMEAFNEG